MNFLSPGTTSSGTPCGSLVLGGVRLPSHLWKVVFSDIWRVSAYRGHLGTNLPCPVRLGAGPWKHVAHPSSPRCVSCVRPSFFELRYAIVHNAEPARVAVGGPMSFIWTIIPS